MKDEIIKTSCTNNIELLDFFAAFALHAILQRNEDRYSDQVTSEALMWANQMMDTRQREGLL
jgi:hypothetical protein